MFRKLVGKLDFFIREVQYLACKDIPDQNILGAKYHSLKNFWSYLWEWTGGSPTPASLPPYPTSLPLAPCFPPLGIFLPPPTKKNKNRYSHHITFHFSAWIIIKALRPEDCRTVCCSSVHLLVCFGVLQPSQRPSRQHCSQVKLCPRRKGKDRGRQDR